MDAEATKDFVILEDFESDKENIAPLLQGRKLGLLVQQPHQSKADTELIQAQIAEYETALANPGDQDVLELWKTYIEWKEQSSVSRQGVLPLLERCTKQLKPLGIYNDDERFLGIWLNYASRTVDPIDIYNYMNANEIGTKHAALYESWAQAYELRGSCAQADQTYQAGINRNAQPLDRLKAKHKTFQKRFMEGILASSMAPKPEPVAAPTKRAPLSSIKSSSSATNVAAPTPAIRKPSKTGPAKSASASTSGAKENRMLAVFVDEEFDDRRSGESNHEAPAPSLSALGGKWETLPTLQQMRKENSPETKKWSDVKIRTRKPAAPAKKVKTEGFSVFVDEDCQEADAPAPVKAPAKPTRRRV